MGWKVVYKRVNKISQVYSSSVLEEGEVLLEPIKPAVVCWRDASEVFVIPLFLQAACKKISLNKGLFQSLEALLI